MIALPLIAFETAIHFLIAAVAITLAPGPDNLMVLSIGLSKGKKAGILFGLGCGCGCISHTVLATLGISALIKSSAIAFNMLLVCGGLYLIWLGFLSFKSGKQEKAGITATVTDASKTQMPASNSHLFIKGFIANAINPKVILFFLALLPSFFDYQSGYISWQAFQLGLLFTIQAAVLFALFGCFSGSLGQWFMKNPNAGVWLDRTAGVVLTLLGIQLLWGVVDILQA